MHTQAFLITRTGLMRMDGWMDELFETGMLHPQEWVFMQVLNSTGTNTGTQIHT